MRKLFAVVFQIACFCLPWAIRRRMLKYVFDFDLHPKSYIGLSIVLARNVVMLDGSLLSNVCFVNSIDELRMGEFSKIGRQNWITGAASSAASFKSTGRKALLHLGQHARITSKHHVDCTGGVFIGEYSTLAGISSQILTHGIDIVPNQQGFAPVSVGRYCFVGSGCILLKGSSLPDYSVLAAGGVLAAKYESPYTLYGGVPAKPLKELPQSAGYFSRANGHVV